jgi:predicted ATPase/DNA-binding SARP family transcriptional activator/DNA-binding CsgD family transcriptional regulator
MCPTTTEAPVPAGDALGVRLLGGFGLAAGAGVVAERGWRLRKARSLVARLALAPDHRQRRAQLAGALWPDLDRGAAANNLDQALHVARRALAPLAGWAGDDGRGGPLPAPLLRREGAEVVLHHPAGVRVDVETFEAPAAAARRGRRLADYEAAVGLYAGDLLPDEPDDEWVAPRREALRQTYLGLLLELAALHERRGDPAAAVAALQRVVDREPAHEPAQADLMRLYARSGQRAEALRQYRQLTAALRDLGATPRPATEQLHRAVLAGRLGTRGVAPCPLPLPLTRFVGRAEELEAVRRALDGARLVTLTGAGGCGKSRLALELVRRLRDGEGALVALAELAPLTDPGLVPQAVASALGVREEPALTLTETLAGALLDRPAVLLLDNCEHLVAACAALTAALLGACPGLRVLATSREPLGLAGELAWGVPSLGVPPLGTAASLPPPEDLLRHDAVRLFTERAQTVQPDFALSRTNAGAVVEVCRRLDGLPLALELAAARLDVLTVEQLAARLDDRFGLLTRGSRTALPRHQTLRAAVDWSYALLDEGEELLLRRLAVFAGGWTLEAAEAVCATGTGRDLVMDRLSRLVAKSLVIAEPAPVRRGRAAGRRFRLLETLRQYALERLAQSGEAAAVRDRHAGHYLAGAERAHGGAIGGLDRDPDTAWFELERENLRAALRWLCERGDAPGGLRLGAALGSAWGHLGHLTEGRAALADVLALPGPTAPTRERARALQALACLATRQTDFGAAEGELSEALAICRAAGDAAEAASALLHLANLAFLRAEHERARAHVAAALASAAAAGLTTRPRGGAAAPYLQGKIALHQRRYGEARARLEDALAACRRTGHRTYEAYTLTSLGYLAVEQGRLAEARAWFTESIAVVRAPGDLGEVAHTLEGFAAVAAGEGQPERALRLAGAAAALRAALGAPKSPAWAEFLERPVAQARRALGAAAAAVWRAGQATPLAAALALALDGRAGAAEARANGGAPALTPREREVAAGVARGLTNRQIASELIISERTVDRHVSNILGKLGCTARAQVAARAVAEGWASPG